MKTGRARARTQHAACYKKKYYEEEKGIFPLPPSLPPPPPPRCDSYQTFQPAGSQNLARSGPSGVPTVIVGTPVVLTFLSAQRRAGQIWPGLALGVWHVCSRPGAFHTGNGKERERDALLPSSFLSSSSFFLPSFSRLTGFQWHSFSLHSWHQQEEGRRIFSPLGSQLQRDFWFLLPPS